MAKSARQSSSDSGRPSTNSSPQRSRPGGSPPFTCSWARRATSSTRWPNGSPRPILDEASRAFNQITVYGRDTDAGQVVNLCRQMPMMGSVPGGDRQGGATVARGIEKLSLLHAEALAHDHSRRSATRRRTPTSVRPSTRGAPRTARCSNRCGRATTRSPRGCSSSSRGGG